MTGETQGTIVVLSLNILLWLLNTWRTELANKNAKLATTTAQQIVTSSDKCDALIQQEKMKSYQLGQQAAQQAAQQVAAQVTESNTEIFRREARRQVEAMMEEMLNRLREREKKG